jgi:phosphatidylglycerophosphatase A
MWALLRPAPAHGARPPRCRWFLLHGLGGFPALAVATVLAFPLGTLGGRARDAGAADTDPSEIVIDEVVGQWIALWPVSAGRGWGGGPLGLSLAGLGRGLRAVPPVRHLETRPGGLGRPAAGRDGRDAGRCDRGAMAAALVVVAAALAHGVLM